MHCLDTMPLLWHLPHNHIPVKDLDEVDILAIPGPNPEGVEVSV
jgi:hypothetical protein